MMMMMTDGGRESVETVEKDTGSTCKGGAQF